MSVRPVIPDVFRSYYDDWKMSPGLVSNDHLFLSGLTGTDKGGRISGDPETQIRDAFGNVATVLREAGLGFEQVVEMSSYHLGLKDHLELFKAVRSEFVIEPFPAWTAIEVAGFVAEGAIVEIRAIARLR